MKITILIPTLNEIAGMKTIMPRIRKEWYDQLIVVDGGSTDGTIEYARHNNYYLIQQKKEGLRCAYTETLNSITGDVIITLSPDGNCIPELIPVLIEKIKEGFDMVIVSRYLNEAKSEDDDFITGLGNWFYTRTVNFLYRARYTDVMGIYRVYRKKLVYDLRLDKDSGYEFYERLFRTHLSWEPLLSVRCAKHKLKVTEISGDEPKRLYGERKLQVWKWGAAYYLQIISEKFLP